MYGKNTKKEKSKGGYKVTAKSNLKKSKRERRRLKRSCTKN